MGRCRQHPGWIALLALLACCARGSDAPTRIVLVTLDTLRLDAFAGGDGNDSAMPRTLARARRGLVFTRSYAASPSTQPTHATLFTGLHPWQHGVVRNGAVLARGAVTLAERLREADFATAAVVASFPLHSRFGFAQGFDLYDEEFDLGASTEWVGATVPAGHFHRLAGAVTDRAVAVLEAMRGPRQFLWVHYFDAHAPYGDTDEAEAPSFDDIAAELEAVTPRGAGDEPIAPDALKGLEARLHQRARQRYDVDVRNLDAALERLLERLEADEARFETHVIVVSDHGESFGEDGTAGHGTRLSDVQIHVPLFVLSPRVAAGTRTDPVGSIDVWAMVLELAGLGSDSPLGSEGPRPVLGMREGAHALDAPPAPPRFFLVKGRDFFRGDGRDVTRNGAPLAGPEQARLRSLFRGFETDLARVRAEPLDDAETRAALEALGYVH